MLLLTEKMEDRGLIQATKSSAPNISSVIFILLKHVQETATFISVSTEH